MDAYTHALRSQIEQPEEPCQNRIRIEAGHTVGKTKLAAAIVNHFFDCFPPAIIYTFAPTWEQIHDLLWKEIKSDRRGSDLPGRILDLELKVSDNHFAKGKATNNAGGQGTERAQGQHGPYLLFVLDEAEGIDQYVWDAVESMTSGGLSIVVMLANPRTRSSRFHKAASDPRVASFRIDCIHHPNVLEGREIVPGAVRRQYVESMIDNGSEQHCEVVSTHDADAHTFELPWRPGVIYRPDSEFLFRVLGIAPANLSDNTFVPPGRYEVAKTRLPSGSQPHEARIGVDVARWGKDFGTVYVRHAGRLYRAASIAQEDTNAYHRAIRDEALRLRDMGVTSLHIRVDGGGGFGGGVIDQLKKDAELLWAFADFQCLEVNNNGTPHDATAFADLVTEMYYHTAQALYALSLDRPPNALEGDLCERQYTWVSARGHEVKVLESKKLFKVRMKRSPDDGDGAALACAPDRIFTQAARPWEPAQLQALSSGVRV